MQLAMGEEEEEAPPHGTRLPALRAEELGSLKIVELSNHRSALADIDPRHYRGNGGARESLRRVEDG